jgi:hypothetical protein
MSTGRGSTFNSIWLFINGPGSPPAATDEGSAGGIYYLLPGVQNSLQRILGPYQNILIAALVTEASLCWKYTMHKARMCFLKALKDQNVKVWVRCEVVGCPVSQDDRRISSDQDKRK